MTFKELERRANHVFEPEGGAGPVYIVEIQAQRSGDVYDRLVLEIALYRKAHPGADGVRAGPFSGPRLRRTGLALGGVSGERPAAAAGVPGRGAGGSQPAPARAPAAGGVPAAAGRRRRTGGTRPGGLAAAGRARTHRARPSCWTCLCPG